MWKKIRITICVLFATLMLFMHSCMTFRMSDKEVDNYFAKHKVSGSRHQYQQDIYTIHYVRAGKPDAPVVMFVHGSPGSLSAFIHFLVDTTLLDKATLIATDRPGFGHSNFGRGEASLQKQAAALKPILETYRQNRPVILVGHSLGGPLIARMAMDYPDLVDGLIIVAGSIDPSLEPEETWFRAPLASPFLSWIVPRSFRASNEEIYHLKPELENMLSRWKEIHCPVTVIQGNNDDLVPPANADFARKMLVNAPVRFVFREDMNHFVPWSHPELIHDAILEMLQTLPARHNVSVNEQ